MATWVVGDVQGCFKPLLRLLKKVRFEWSRDVLWSCGDIVNRGPQCLETLRFFYRHAERIRMVLGNHDLHLLAIACGACEPGRADTLGPILAAPDRDVLIEWLRRQPLLHREHGVTLVHAGIPPQWSVEEAAGRAREVEAALRGPHSRDFFSAMYGNEPRSWSESLAGRERLRLIANYFTRMRYCDPHGALDLLSKGPLSDPGGPAADNPRLDAWFRHPARQSARDTILFGHWAALQGQTGVATAIALDSGCVWGQCMTLYSLESGERVTEPCA